MKKEIREEIKKDHEKTQSRGLGLKNIAAATGIALAGALITWAIGFFIKRLAKP